MIAQVDFIFNPGLTASHAIKATQKTKERLRLLKKSLLQKRWRNEGFKGTWDRPLYK